jgi:hypothetical protein
MLEPAAHIRDGDGHQCLPNSVIEGRSVARFGFPPVALDQWQIRRVKDAREIVAEEDSSRMM